MDGGVASEVKGIEVCGEARAVGDGAAKPVRSGAPVFTRGGGICIPSAIGRTQAMREQHGMLEAIPCTEVGGENI